MLAFELPSAGYVARFQSEMRKNGIKVSLSSDKFVRYLPPLIVTEEDVDFLLTAVDKAFAKIL